MNTNHKPYETVKRNWLKKQVELGKMEVKCNYKLTDDYAFDNAYNFQKTDWMPARMSHPTWSKRTNYVGNEVDVCDNEDRIDGYMNLRDYEFEGKSGGAYWNDKGTITLRVYSGFVYELRPITEAPKPAPVAIVLPSRFALMDEE